MEQFFVHWNGGAWMVKAGDFFHSQTDGKGDDWKDGWKPVDADGIECGGCSSTDGRPKARRAIASKVRTVAVGVTPSACANLAQAGLSQTTAASVSQNKGKDHD